MARVIFLATVLVALCYTSQAFPPEHKEKLEKLKDLLNQKKEWIEKLKELRSRNHEQYGINGLLDSLLKAIDETLEIPLHIIGGLRKGVEDTRGKLSSQSYTVTEVVGIWDDVKSQWGKIKDKVEDAIEKGQDKLNEKLNEGKELLEEMANQGKQKVGELWEEVKDETNRKLDDAKDNLKKIDEGLKEMFN